MIKPYFEDKWCKIFHADCRDILPELPRADIIIVDPPYGINYQSARRVAWQRKDKIKNDDAFPLWIFDELKPRIALFVWCRWDILPQIPAPKSFIVWDKMVHSMGDLNHEFGRQWEAIAFYPGPEHEFKYRPIDLIQVPKVPAKKLIHPNEKPVAAIIPLIKCHDASTMTDPMCGSGSALLSAKMLGIKSIGIEISERYCEIAANRMRQEILDFG